MLESLENKTISDIEKETLILFNNNSQELQKEVLNHCMQHCSFEENYNKEKVLTNFRQRASAIVVVNDIFNNSKDFITREDIEEIVQTKYPQYQVKNVQNRLLDAKGVYSMPSHGLWGKLDYFEFKEEDVSLVLDYIRKFKAEFIGSNKEQFHAREIIEKYLLNLDIANDLKNSFVIAALIQENFDIPYLGRSVFSNPNSEVGKRLYIHKVIVDILIKNKKPMHSKDLLAEVKKIRSIDEKYFQIHYKAPLKKIGSNKCGLDYWEDNL